MRRGAVGLALALAGAGALAWWFASDLAAPEVDPTLERAVRSVVDEHLSRGPWPGYLANRRGSAWFCSADMIELRREGAELKVGLLALCQEYARAGDELLCGSGEHGPKLVTLVSSNSGPGPARYEVRHVQSARDGASYWPSVQQMFSRAGQAELRRLEAQVRPSELADPAVEARQAFGLPPGTACTPPSRWPS
jgi:hypothetical protein